MGCPLLVGLGEGENFVASDVSAVISATRQVIFLEEGDTAELTRAGVRVFDATDREAVREVHVSDVSLASLELGPYRHFMQKEIHEQPRAIADTIEAAVDAGGLPGCSARMPNAVLRGVEACRSSPAAPATTPGSPRLLDRGHRRAAVQRGDRQRIPLPRGLRRPRPAGRHHLPVRRNAGHDGGAQARQVAGPQHTLSICNVPERHSARQRLVLYTRAGAEIGVASTKAFTTQLAALFQLTWCWRASAASPPEREAEHGAAALPAGQRAARAEPGAADRGLGENVRRKSNALFLGRGLHYPIALEGALKLKEISYIHAEAYPAASSSTARWRWWTRHAGGGDRAQRQAAGKAQVEHAGSARARRRAVRVRRQDSNFNEPEGVHVIRTPRHAGCCRRSCTPSRCSCWPTTPRWRAAPTWTSRAIWPRARWSEVGRGGLKEPRPEHGQCGSAGRQETPRVVSGPPETQASGVAPMLRNHTSTAPRSWASSGCRDGRRPCRPARGSSLR
jgi:glucosamine--fructose-6-phosphate aminotransferase (isomerizing)